MAGSTPTKVTVTFKFLFSLEGTVSFYVAPGIVDPNDATIQAIVAAINALTRGIPIRIEVSASNPIVATATTSQVYVNEDKAEFVFNSDSGKAHTFKLPGLKPSILASNKEDIPGTGLVGTFLDALATAALDADGGVLTAPLGGKRRTSRKTLKK